MTRHRLVVTYFDGDKVEQAWQLDDSGEFIAEQSGTRGAWIPCDDALTVEFLSPNDADTDTGDDAYTEAGGDDDNAQEQRQRSD